MTCPYCEGSIPPDARFCIYCRAQVVPPAAKPSLRPVTGPTVRLDPAAATPAAHPVPPISRTYPAPGRGRSQRSLRRQGGNAGIFPFGLLILFVTGWWWPGILVLLAFSALMDGAGRGRHRAGLPALLVALGLVLLWHAHHAGALLWLFSPLAFMLAMMLPLSMWWFWRH